MEIKNLKFKSKNELITICKNKNIKGYSKLNKNELVKHIKIYNKIGFGKNSNCSSCKNSSCNSCNTKFSLFNIFGKKKIYTDNNEFKSIVKTYILLKYHPTENPQQSSTNGISIDLNWIESEYGKIEDWDVSNITDMSELFSGEEDFNEKIGNWNVSNVNTMSKMFKNCKKFNQPLNDWTVTNVNYMDEMFYGCTKFNQPLDKWEVENVIYMDEMFYGCTEFNQNLNNWFIGNVSSSFDMFCDASSFDPSNIRDWQRFIDVNQLLRCNTDSNYTLRAPTDYTSTRSRKNIIITKNMLSSNTCNTKLYDMLLKINSQNVETLKQNTFKFNGEVGIDAGGLSRTVYDIFFRTYLNKFFILNDYFYILKNLIDLKEFSIATVILITLSEKAEVHIVLPINPELINFVKPEQNVKNYQQLIESINLKQKNKYVIRKGYNLSKKNDLEALGFNNLNNVMAENENKNKNYKFETVNTWSNNDKNKIYLRIYITKFGFESIRQFKNMIQFMDDYIFNKMYDFKNEISFAKKDFFKRIKIIKPGEKSNKAIKIPKNIKSNAFINQHPNLKLLLNYINQKDNEYRENFNIWITGSKYSEAELKLFVNKEKYNSPYKVATCFNYVDIYQTDKITGMNNKNMLDNLDTNIQKNINNRKFTTA